MTERDSATLNLMVFAFIVCWVAGIAVAKGFWTIVACILVPPYSWILFAKWVIEKCCA